jgi:hypothetical protein
MIMKKNQLKRLLSLFMALALLLTLFPAAAFTVSAAAGDEIFFVPSNTWKTDNARFAAYFFGAGETWIDMTDTDGDGTYEGTIPSGGYTGVIFCRMNPSASANNSGGSGAGSNEAPDTYTPPALDEGLTYFADIEINVTEFDYETALVDFNYTVNSDGTITLGWWKQTLNGEPSTEMIIPNNGLIII